MDSRISRIPIIDKLMLKKERAKKRIESAPEFGKRGIHGHHRVGYNEGVIDVCEEILDVVYPGWDK